MASKKIIWKFLLSRRWTILRCELFTKGYVEPLKKYVGVPNRNLLVTKELEKYSLYNGLESLKEISIALVAELNKNKNFGKKIYKDCLASCNNLVEVSKKVSRGELSSLRVSTLVNRLDDYFDAVYNFTPFLALSNNYEMYITNKIKEFLSKKVGQEKVEVYLQKLMAPKEYPFQVLEQIDLAKIALKMKKKAKIDVNQELNRYKKKYQWLSCYNYDEDEFSPKDIKERLDVLLDLSLEELKDKTETIINKLKQDELEFPKTIKEVGLSGELLNQVKLLREFVFLRTYRIEMNSQSNFYLKPLIEEVSKRGDISIRQLAMMLPDEIKKMVKNGKVPKTVNFKDREKAAVFWLDDCQYHCVFGGEAKKIISKKLVDFKTTAKADEIKGVTASKGKTVRGKVRIISKNNVSDFRKGEILVTVMTSPEFVPAMQKAAAIVTDEGGVLCHAAIVSRELKKPCVIGTQIATKIFKTGDSIEVNAKKGIVKKVEK